MTDAVVTTPSTTPTCPEGHSDWPTVAQASAHLSFLRTVALVVTDGQRHALFVIAECSAHTRPDLPFRSRGKARMPSVEICGAAYCPPVEVLMAKRQQNKTQVPVAC